MTKIRYPFGDADEVSVTAGAAMAPPAIDNQETKMTISQMAAGGTLNLTLSENVRIGAKLRIKVSADGTNRTLTPGTGMTGTAQTITANKSFLLTYWYDGATFVHQSSQVSN